MALVAAVTTGCATGRVAPPTGEQTFATHCASCHGDRGAGDGAVAAVLAVPVPNLQTLTLRNGGQFPSDTVAGYIDGRSFPASHGNRTMPVWGRIFDTTADIVVDADNAASRIEALLSHLEELQISD